MITVHKDIYAISTNPKNIFKSEVSLKNAIIIYSISIVSVIVSCLYIGYSSSNILVMATLMTSAIGYFFVSILVKLSIIHTTACMSTKYKNGKNIKTLLADTFLSTIVFIPILPITLILDGIPLGSSICILVMFVAFVIYICSIYLVILNTFEMTTNWHAILLIVMPFLYDTLLFYLFLALFFSMIANFIVA